MQELSSNVKQASHSFLGENHEMDLFSWLYIEPGVQVLNGGPPWTVPKEYLNYQQTLVAY